jgi:hypothetical protein
MRFSLLLVLTFLFIFSVDLKAQGLEDFYEQRLKEKPFNPGNNIIKINPLLFFLGDIPVNYERSLNNRWSVEAGAGITRRNYIHEFWEAASDPEGGYNLDARIAKTGYSARAGLRFYPTDAGKLQGFYFASEFLHRMYASEVMKVHPDERNRFISETLPANRYLSDARIVIGFNDFFESKMMVDYYIGLGLRSKIVHKVVVGDEVLPGGGAIYVTKVTRHPEEGKIEIKPVLSMGFKLGMAF